jgi:hypothetical protein
MLWSDVVFMKRLRDDFLRTLHAWRCDCLGLRSVEVSSSTAFVYQFMVSRRRQRRGTLFLSKTRNISYKGFEEICFTGRMK